MARFVGYLTIGVIEGLLYGLLALGIVLIYKGSRILNFAQASFALVAAFFCWWFTYKAPLPFDAGTRPRYALGVLLSLAVIGLNGYAVEHSIIRRLRTAPRLVLLASTLAISAGNSGFVLLLFQRNERQRNEAHLLPSFVTTSFTLGTKFVKGSDIEILIVVPLICAALAVFFTKTRFGVAVRAVADNRDAARLLGVPASRVSVFTWVVGSLLAALAGMMITSHRGSLDLGSISTGFLVAGLISALVGGLTSLPGAIVGGLVVGVIQSMASFLFAGTQGANDVALVLLVLAILIFKPSGIFGAAEETEDKAAFVPSLRPLPGFLAGGAASRGFQAAGALVVLFIMGMALVTGSGTNSIIATVLCYGIVGVSLTVLIGFTGQISLGHWGIAGFGAYVCALLTHKLATPWPIAVLSGTVAGGVLALVIGLPALRIRGLYLAVATMAFHVAATSFIFRKLGGTTAGVPVHLPKYGPVDLDSPSGRSVTFVCLLGLVASIVAAGNLLRSRAGRSLLAVRENEKAAATLGVSLTGAKLLGFGVSGALAGFGGSLYVTNAGTAQQGQWDLSISFLLVVMVVIGGLGSTWGPVLGAFLLFGLPLLFPDINQWAVSIGSAALVFLAATRLPGGLAGLVQLIRDKIVVGVATLDPATRKKLAEVSGPAGGTGNLEPATR
jgi:ABC-type branched-subunit amino acid transport system permease subunit